MISPWSFPKTHRESVWGSAMRLNQGLTPALCEAMEVGGEDHGATSSIMTWAMDGLASP